MLCLGLQSPYMEHVITNTKLNLLMTNPRKQLPEPDGLAIYWKVDNRAILRLTHWLESCRHLTLISPWIAFVAQEIQQC